MELGTKGNILFISYDGMTDPLGQSQVIPYLAGLTKHGYKFTILSCDKPETYQARKNYVNSLLQELPIKWKSIPYHKNPPVLSSIYDLQNLKKTAAALHKNEKFDMVHTRPGVPTLAGLWLKKKYGIKFLNDIRGFWADERVDGGMWNLKNPLFKKVYSFFKKHEYECLDLADKNTCLTNEARKEILKWDNLKGQPLDIEVIPCSADLELFNRNNIDIAERNRLAKEMGIEPGDFIISYLGSIGGWYLTKEMMHFCSLAASRLPDAKFLFISPHRHEIIMDAAIQYGLDPARIITRNASRHEVPIYLSFSDYSLFFIKLCYSKISSSPTKHGEIMAMGIPVITNSGVGDVKEIVEKYNAGFVIDEFSDASFKQVIEKIAEHPEIDRNRIRRGAEEIYSLDNAIETYAGVYKGILNN